MPFKQSKSPKVSTVIGVGTEITGDIKFKGGMHIDGKVIGNISGEDGSTSAITVSDQGIIEGSIKIDSIVLNGTVTGDIHGEERVELASQARVNGTVYYNMLEMAMGAEVNGQLVHSESKEQRRLEYDGAAASSTASTTASTQQKSKPWAKSTTAKDAKKTA